MIVESIFNQDGLIYLDSFNKIINTEADIIVSGVSVLLIGGGGSGGYFAGGGGGAGGFLYQTGYTLFNSIYNIVIGNGGTGINSEASWNGNAGESSLLYSTKYTPYRLEAFGGGGGGTWNVGYGGGCGAGGGYRDYLVGGTGTQGYNGGRSNQTLNPQIITSPHPGAGGGGGGAGQAGANPTYVWLGTATAGNGGNGLSNSITGSAVVYAGGGGGGGDTYSITWPQVYGGDSTPGAGGSGGGGAGSKTDGTNGTANLGGGGGGAGVHDVNHGNDYSGSGGSGVVIIRYTSPVVRGIGGTITQVGGDWVHKYTTNGTFIFTP